MADVEQRVYVKGTHPKTSDDPQMWQEGEVKSTLNLLEDANEFRATAIVVMKRGRIKE